MSESRGNGFNENGVRGQGLVVAARSHARDSVELAGHPVRRSDWRSLVETIVLVAFTVTISAVSIIFIVLVGFQRPAFGVGLLVGMLLAMTSIAIQNLQKAHTLGRMLAWVRAHRNFEWISLMSLYSYHALRIDDDAIFEYEDYVGGYVWARNRMEAKAILRGHGLKAVMLRKGKWWHALLISPDEIDRG